MTEESCGGSAALPRPLFSIVIPTYNYARYLARALDSVSAQSGDDYEIVVIDDGSTDETARVVAEWTHRAGKGALYFAQRNRGLAAARNRGIDLSTGEFVLFLDADDALLPNALDRFRSAVDHQECLDFVYGGRTLAWVDGKVKMYPARRHLPSSEQNFSRYIRDGFTELCAGSAVIRRRVFDRIRFHEHARVWEDVIFHAQLFALFSGASFPDPVITIHRHRDSLSHHPDLDSIARSDQWLFDPSVLPKAFFRFRDLYRCRTRIALFHSLYDQGKFQDAVRTLREATGIRLVELLSWRLVRRYVTALMKRRRETVRE